MSGYSDGRRVEYAVIAELREAGYDIVRGSSSKGFADVTGITDDEIALISVKRTRPPGPKERTKLLAVAARIPMYAQPVIALGPASRVTYRLLTGPGAHDWREWHPTSKESS